jgi:hypothetical protein
MDDQEHDAIIEIDRTLARVRALSHQSRLWIETHVTLEQVQTWTGSVLEIAPHYVGDLIAGMHADGLQVATIRGQLIGDRSAYSTVLFLAHASKN